MSYCYECGPSGPLYNAVKRSAVWDPQEAAFDQRTVDTNGNGHTLLLINEHAVANVVRDRKANEGPWTGKCTRWTTRHDTVQTLMPMSRHLYDGTRDNGSTRSEAYNNSPCGAGRGPGRTHACTRWDTRYSPHDP